MEPEHKHRKTPEIKIWRPAKNINHLLKHIDLDACGWLDFEPIVIGRNVNVEALYAFIDKHDPDGRPIFRYSDDSYCFRIDIDLNSDGTDTGTVYLSPMPSNAHCELAYEATRCFTLHFHRDERYYCLGGGSGNQYIGIKRVNPDGRFTIYPSDKPRTRENAIFDITLEVMRSQRYTERDGILEKINNYCLSDRSPFTHLLLVRLLGGKKLQFVVINLDDNKSTGTWYKGLIREEDLVGQVVDLAEDPDDLVLAEFSCLKSAEELRLAGITSRVDTFQLKLGDLSPEFREYFAN